MTEIFNYAGFAVGLIGAVLTIYYARRANAISEARRRLGWSDLVAASDDLADRITNELGRSPAAILTPGLRGATISNLLARDLPGDPPTFVGISIWISPNEPAVQINERQYFKIDTEKWHVYVPRAVLDIPRDEDILIVDDFAMSGDFQIKFKGELVKRGFSAGKIHSVAVAVTKVAIANHKAPDYYWFVTDADEFYFPWGKAR